jgi:hypothetical protein
VIANVLGSIRTRKPENNALNDGLDFPSDLTTYVLLPACARLFVDKEAMLPSQSE